MKRKDLIEAVAKRAGLRRDQAHQAVEALVDVIGDTLARGRTLRLRRLGEFSAVFWPGRIMNDPVSRKPHYVDGRGMVKFRPDATLRRRARGAFES